MQLQIRLIQYNLPSIRMYAFMRFIINKKAKKKMQLLQFC